MAFSRLLFLLLLLGLITFAGLAAAPPPGCDLSTLAPKLARHCQSDPDVPSFLHSPSSQCCEALLASVPGHEETTLLCLCRAAAESPLVNARLDVARLFGLYRGCSNGSFGRDPGFANWYCEVERTMDTATAVCTAETLATKVSQFCVIDERFPECCKAVVNTVVLNGRPPCLCRVAAEPQLAAAGLNATGILELYSSCGGRSPVGPHVQGHGLPHDLQRLWRTPASDP